MGENKRPDPDALLANLNQGRGKLSVFLGAVAGVGKTYAMLEAAREGLAEGWDIVAGWVDTHGRKETEALLQDIPLVPPRKLEYRGKEFPEMDLDALLARKPEIALVDELAHTNVSGSRHARRYQDVEELLQAGINVITTLNIQHVESLNDIVARITGVTVGERVPDKILENAEIKLVDIPAEDLIARLKEGKVYVPGQAAEALKKFFRPGNINALRELALRYTAQRVDRQLENYMRAKAIAGPWPAGEKVLVCVSPSPFAPRLIRVAKRTAAGLHADLLAVYIEPPNCDLSETERNRLTKSFRLAEALGAEIITLTRDDVAEGLLEFARDRNVTQIVIGNPLHFKFGNLFRGSVVDQVIRRSEGISVHVISADSKEGKGSEQPPKKKTRSRKNKKVSRMAYVWGILGITLLTLMLKIWGSYLGQINIALLFLLPVLFTAVKWGHRVSVVMAFLAILAYDFFLVPPFRSFTVADIRYAVSFLIFMTVALLTGTMSQRLKNQVHAIRQREVRMAALNTLSQKIAFTIDLNTVLDTLVKKISETLDGQVVVFLAEENEKLLIRAGTFLPIDENELAVSTWVFHHNQAAGRGTDTLNGVQGLYLPLSTEQGVVGVLGIHFNKPEYYFHPEYRHLLEAFSSLAAVAVTRIKLWENAQEAHLLKESDRLYSALLNSLSHDLHTPLASIIGAITGLIEGEEIYDAAARRELFQTINQESQRMNRLVNNLLDMTRLEGGILKLKKEWCDLEDIIGVVMGRQKEFLAKRTVKIVVEPALPLVLVDFVLIEQVLVNLMDNALKYSDPESEISLSAHRRDEWVELAVTNLGREIPPGDLEKIFEKFYRIHSMIPTGGSGLGLAICKGIIEAHGGKIRAQNNPGQGVTFAFTLPLPERIPDDAGLEKEGNEDEPQRSPGINH